jgi:hypothetical protein
MPKKTENFSFWDFAIPQIQGGAQAANKAIQEGDPEWADSLLDSVETELGRARDQTQRQIAERDAGTYRPARYHESGQECPRSNPKHKDFEPEVPPDRNAWRRQ